MKMKDLLRAYLDMKKRRALRGFLLHLGSYVLVSFLTAFWNHYYGNYPWHVWMMFGWGFGVLLHENKFYGRVSSIDFEDIDDFIEKYAERVQKNENRAFKRHFLSYIVVNSIIIALSLLIYPKYFFFPFVLFGWGIGILCHYFGIRNLKDKVIKKFESIRKLIEREML